MSISTILLILVCVTMLVWAIYPDLKESYKDLKKMFQEISYYDSL